MIRQTVAGFGKHIGRSDYLSDLDQIADAAGLHDWNALKPGVVQEHLIGHTGALGARHLHIAAAPPI